MAPEEIVDMDDIGHLEEMLDRGLDIHARDKDGCAIEGHLTYFLLDHIIQLIRHPSRFRSREPALEAVGHQATESRCQYRMVQTQTRKTQAR